MGEAKRLRKIKLCSAIQINFFKILECWVECKRRLLNIKYL